MRLIKLSLLFGTLLGYASAAYAVPHCTVWGELQSKADTNIVSMNSPSKSQFDLLGRLIYRPLLVAEKFHWLGFELYQAHVCQPTIVDILRHAFGQPVFVSLYALSWRGS